MQTCLAFELCCQNHHTGIGNFETKLINMVQVYVSGSQVLQKVFKNVKIRVQDVRYEGYCRGVVLGEGRYLVALASGQVVKISVDSFDVYDTVTDEGVCGSPLVLGHVTNEWLSDVLGGPKYSPKITDFIRLSVPVSPFATPKQRIKYFTEGETRRHPKGKPKLAFIKLGSSRAQPPGSELQYILSAREKREIYLYSTVLHDFAMPIAPCCYHAARHDTVGASVCVLQDLGLWRRLPETGITTEKDASDIGRALGWLHSRYLANVEDLSHHFIEPRVCFVDEYLSSVDGVKEALANTLEIMKSGVVETSSVKGMGSVSFSNKWMSIADDVEGVGALFDDMPMTLSHMNLIPEHIFLATDLAPSPSSVFFVDWKRAKPAPIGCDLASLATLTPPELTPALLDSYASTLPSAAAYDVSTLTGCISRCLLPLLVSTVCYADDMVQLATLQHGEAAISNPSPPLREALTRVVQVTQACVRHSVL